MNWSGPPILAVQSPNAPTPTHKATGSTADATTRCTPRRTAAKLFWSATVYDVDTRCLVDNDQQRGDRGSRDGELVSNADRSVDLSFGPPGPSPRRRPPAARGTGSRPSPAATGFPTSASTARWSRTSTEAGNSATSLPPKGPSKTGRRIGILGRALYLNPEPPTCRAFLLPRSHAVGPTRAQRAA